MCDKGILSLVVGQTMDLFHKDILDRSIFYTLQMKKDYYLIDVSHVSDKDSLFMEPILVDYTPQTTLRQVVNINTMWIYDCICVEFHVDYANNALLTYIYS
jgi:hypothetical protein